MRKSPNFNNTWGRVGGGVPPKKMEKVCNYWAQGSCSFGEKCKFLHSWSIGDCFSLLTTLEGHQKVMPAVSSDFDAISLLSSNLLFVWLIGLKLDVFGSGCKWDRFASRER